MTLGSFAAWSEVIAHAKAGGALWYHAPLDYSPVAVHVTWRSQASEVTRSRVGSLVLGGRGSPRSLPSARGRVVKPMRADLKLRFPLAAAFLLECPFEYGEMAAFALRWHGNDGTAWGRKHQHDVAWSARDAATLWLAI